LASEVASALLFYLVNGLIWGLIIALIALGLSFIFGVMGIVNMAHGDLYMLGAVFAYWIFSALGNFWLSLLIVPVAIGLLAAPTERLILRPFEGHPAVTMIATAGLSFILQQLVLMTYGGVPKELPMPLQGSFDFLGVAYPLYRLFIAALSLVIIASVWLFLHRTDYGILVRASMQDKEIASAMGINVNTVLVFTFVLGCVLAAVGGVLAAPVTQVFYLMGNDVILLCFIVVIIGGLGSLGGTLVAALVLGGVEGLLAYFLSPTGARAAVFAFMVGVLILRPQGLFGTQRG